MIVILFNILLQSNAQTLYYVQDSDALCLDGSKASYYYSEGYGTGEDKFIFHFEGGAWIQGLTEQQLLYSAYKRSETELGSSQYNPSTTTYSGIFSRNSGSNPDFYNWHHININYCDGTGHQGYKKDFVEYLGKPLYFKGTKIIHSIINEFNDRLLKSKTVIVAGCSAGGLAAYYWVQYFRDILSSTINVLGIPDSGIFIDMNAIDGTNQSKESLQQMIKLVNNEVSNPNQECIQDNSNEIWKCYYAQYLVRYIHTPLFIINSLYDSASIQDLLKISCVKSNSLQYCTQKERNYIDILYQNIQLVISGRAYYFNDTGSFAPSCVEHCFLQRSYYNQQSWSVPYQSGNTIQKSLRQWLITFNQQEDDNHIDYVEWPNNSGCSNQK